MSPFDILGLVVATGSALMAGMFFAFSNVVMPALGMQPAPAGIRSMQAIDVTVMNPIFLSIFTGTAVLGVALAIWAVIGGGNLLAAIGGLVYAVGTFGITAAINVPMNNRLSSMQADSSQAAGYWKIYLRDWVFWNTVRTWAAMVALLLIVLGMAA